MGFIILTVIGAVLGWLATILLRIEDERSILANIAAGVLGSLVGGFVAGNGLVFGAVSGTALLWATAAAIVVVALLNFVRSRVHS